MAGTQVVTASFDASSEICGMLQAVVLERCVMSSFMPKLTVDHLRDCDLFVHCGLSESGTSNDGGF